MECSFFFFHCGCRAVAFTHVAFTGLFSTVANLQTEIFGFVYVSIIGWRQYECVWVGGVFVFSDWLETLFGGVSVIEPEVQTGAISSLQAHMTK